MRMAAWRNSQTVRPNGWRYLADGSRRRRWFGNDVVMRFNGSMTSGASWTVFRFLRQYHVTDRDFPSGYIYGAQRYGYVETTLVWYTSVYIYVLGYISVVPHTTTTPSAPISSYYTSPCVAVHKDVHIYTTPWHVYRQYRIWLCQY